MSITTVENNIIANLKENNFAVLYGKQFTGKNYLANKIFKQRFQLELNNDTKAKKEAIREYNNETGLKGYILIFSKNKLNELEEKIRETSENFPIILIFHGTLEKMLANTNASTILNEFCRTASTEMVELKDRKTDIFPIFKQLIKIPNINYENGIADYLEKIDWEKYDLSLLVTMARLIRLKYNDVEEYPDFENVAIDLETVIKVYSDNHKRHGIIPPCPNENERGKDGYCLDIEEKNTKLGAYIKKQNMFEDLIYKVLWVFVFIVYIFYNAYESTSKTEFYFKFTIYNIGLAALSLFTTPLVIKAKDRIVRKKG